jgi:hypothetical protein
MATILRQRRDTAANWSSANPVIPDGQLCFDTTNNTFRVGDGTTNYSSLSIQSGTPGDMSGANNLSEIVTPATARTNLGLTIGTDVQAYDAQLADVAGLTVTDGNFIVGDGTNFVAENPATARTSLGLGTAATSASTAFETADTDISKTDVAEIRTANIDLLTYTEKYITIGTNGVIDLSLGSVFTHTHGGSMSAFTVSSVPTTGTSGFVLILVNGGSYPLAWWVGSGTAAIKWPAATPPTLTAAGTDIFTFTTPDSGVTWYGIPSGIGMA